MGGGIDQVETMAQFVVATRYSDLSCSRFGASRLDRVLVVHCRPTVVANWTFKKEH